MKGQVLNRALWVPKEQHIPQDLLSVHREKVVETQVATEAQASVVSISLWGRMEQWNILLW
jgi:hypothetical protein